MTTTTHALVLDLKSLIVIPARKLSFGKSDSIGDFDLTALDPIAKKVVKGLF